MVEWKPDPTLVSAEQAVVGEFRLIVFDQPPDHQLAPAKAVWGILGPPGQRIVSVLARGTAPDVNAAKVAAERALAELVDRN
jgi:hypothetical protein